MDNNERQATPQEMSTGFIEKVVLPNIVNGAFWGFISKADCVEYADGIKSNPNIRLYPLGEMALAEVDGTYMLSEVVAKDAAVVKIIRTLSSDADFVSAIKRFSGEASAYFEKWLMKNACGYAGNLGIYCINDTPAITYQNQSYPAFRINGATVTQLLRKWGFQVRVGGNFLPCTLKTSELLKSAVLSPTLTGVFINVRSTLNQAQVTAIKAQMGLK